MNEELERAEAAIIAHLEAKKAPQFIGQMVTELRKPGQVREASLRAAVWILAGQGRVKIDYDSNASLLPAAPVEAHA